MKAIYIDSFQLHSNTSDLGYFVSPGIAGLEYSVPKVIAYDRAGEHGAIVSNTFVGSRRVTLEGVIYAATQVLLETRRRQVIAAFSQQKDSYGIPIARVLKVTTMDDLTVKTNVYLQQPIKMVRDNLNSARFMIDLYSPDFDLQNDILNISTLNVPSGGGAVYPIIYPIIYAASTGGTGLLVNSGDAPHYPIIYLNGPLDNPIISNQTTGRYLELTASIASGEQVVINMKNRTIIKSPSTSYISTLTSPSKFWWLDPGNNTVSFVTSNTSNTGNCQIHYRDSFFGV